MLDIKAQKAPFIFPYFKCWQSPNRHSAGGEARECNSKILTELTA
jgi:hypothetical protein